MKNNYKNIRKNVYEINRPTLADVQIHINWPTSKFKFYFILFMNKKI